MEVVLDANKSYSFADYLTWLDDKRRELFNGIVKLMSPAPRAEHAIVSTNITIPIGNFIKRNKGKCKLFYAPFDVRLPKNGEKADKDIYTVVQPDICVVCDPSKLDYRGCLGAPDLIVEILSPSTLKRDFNDKYYIYQTAGVKEYWIADPANKTITVFLLSEKGEYGEGALYEYERAAKIPVNTLPGLELDLKEVFGEIV